MTPRYTKATALAVLNGMNTRDAIEVIRQYSDGKLTDSNGWLKIDAGLDQCIDDLFEIEPEPRFVSSGFNYIEYPREGGVLL